MDGTDEGLEIREASSRGKDLGHGVDGISGMGKIRKGTEGMEQREGGVWGGCRAESLGGNKGVNGGGEQVNMEGRVGSKEESDRVNKLSSV